MLKWTDCVGAWVFHTFKDPDSGWVVVDPSGGSQGCSDDGWGWNEVVGECVVEVSLLLFLVLCKISVGELSDVPVARRHRVRHRIPSRI